MGPFFYIRMMVMLKARNYILLLFHLVVSLSFGQDATAVKTNYLSELEQYKLTYIKKLIDSVGLSAPIKGEEIIKHAAYVTSYNTTHRTPNYVVHVLPKDVLYSTQSRSNDFRPDPLVKKNMSGAEDYQGSGFDRGHMAPSADFNWSKIAVSESFYYSNMVPQNPGLNRGTWRKLEMKIREWAIDNNELIIVSGPILKDGLPKIQGGSFNVSIPEYLYKIVLDYYPPTYKAIAFLYPNRNVPMDLEDHVVSIDSIEHLTGIDFFQKLNDKIERTIEAEQDISQWETDLSDNESSSKFIPKDFGKGKINSTQVNDFIGKEVCICGKVVGAKYTENGTNNPTYINLDKKYPNQLFTIMIFGDARRNFSYKPEQFLLQKTICVKGKITTFRGSPQIIATKEKQIEVEE